MIMDTGSANLWVLDSGCETVNKILRCPRYCQNDIFCLSFCQPVCCNAVTIDDYCYGRPRFCSNQSTTYKTTSRTFQIVYGTGSAAGIVGKELVQVGSLTIENADLGQASQIDEFFASGIVDGIFGMGQIGLAKSGTIPPLYSAVSQGLMLPYFTFWLDSNGLHSNFGKGGEITYGDVDIDHCGPVYWIPLSSNTYWQFRVEHLKIGNQYVGFGEGISDTGTSFLGLPPLAINVIKTLTNFRQSQVYGYIVDCNTTISLVFSINGKQFTVAQEQLVLEAYHYGGQKLCVLAIFSTEDAPMMPKYLLGDPFIRSYCQVYDMENRRIGFAKSL
ncbi:unnamed protein product [Bursaphelenchus okinawaensis]|uniref:Peptidase A1 domain-containing protein n=1 Tax=Bursaphelenchus okinawaensis TaxID=465554 RepID=A0A811LIB4_9BILA|nr:unnamed protein product [Bursaphelenchus okinawaensis]CAG9123158.1 unnamed protein product [Bursaphelenchus okinawaensis]